jgi:nucleoside-diphosphate-sugar epimerase
VKVILTGATGFVGAEVLRQLFVHADVSAVTVLTRRPLSVTHPKLTAVLHDDFAAYDDQLLASLADHGACIWTLGGKASDFDSPADYERVTHRFTLAFARGVASHEQPFSFCCLSGMGADPTESSRLPWERMTRHLKGRTERDLAALSTEHPGFSSYAFRPGGILPVDGSPLVQRLLAPWVVRVDVLAAAMMHVAMRGHRLRTIENAEIKVIARPA